MLSRMNGILKWLCLEPRWIIKEKRECSKFRVGIKLRTLGKLVMDYAIGCEPKKIKEKLKEQDEHKKRKKKKIKNKKKK